MRIKPFQIIGVVLLLAASGFALRRFYPANKPLGNSVTIPSEKLVTKNLFETDEENGLQPSGLNVARREFVTSFTVERLSVEHVRVPTVEEWEELTRILLYAEDEELVDEVKARFSVHAGGRNLAALVAAYEKPPNDDTRQRIMDVFSTLQSADFQETARKILNDKSRPITDHLVCASALSLARMGGEQDILFIFARLNDAGEDPVAGGSLYPVASGLVEAMIEVRNPALADLLMNAAAGRGVAITGPARMAAAAALANYHTVQVTEILYDLSNNETDVQVRKQAERSLRAIQTNE